MIRQSIVTIPYLKMTGGIQRTLRNFGTKVTRIPEILDFGLVAEARVRACVLRAIKLIKVVKLILTLRSLSTVEQSVKGKTCHSYGEIIIVSACICVSIYVVASFYNNHLYKTLMNHRSELENMYNPKTCTIRSPIRGITTNVHVMKIQCMYSVLKILRM